MRGRRVIGGVAGFCLLFSAGGSSAHAATFPGENGKALFSPWASEAPFHLGTPDDPTTEAGAYPPEFNLKRENLFPSSFDPSGTRLAFTLERGKRDIPGCDPDEPTECAGEHEVYVADLDGSNVQQVTDTAAFEHSPVWGPDGQSVAYISGSSLMVEDLETGAIETVTGNARSVDWSPDGETFVVGRQGGPGVGTEILTIDADTGTEHVLATPLTGGGASFSPDGNEVVFGRYEPIDSGPLAGNLMRNGYTIPVDSPTNEGQQLIYDTEDHDLYEFGGGVWSPDASVILVSTQDFRGIAGPEDTTIFSVSPDGGPIAPVAVNADPNADGAIAWQPLPVLDGVAADAAAGERVSTGEAVDPAAPAEAAVTTPNAGEVSIQRIGPATDIGPGFRVLGTEFRITAPDADVESPLILEFLLDASLLPAGASVESVEILRDGTAAGDCTEPVAAVPDPCIAEREALAGGDALITVRSSDASAWNLALEDSVAPETSIGKAPPSKTKKRKVTFEFEASEEAAFECKLDSAGWQDCGSPYKTSKLSYGKHRFQVRATDLAENLGAPAKRSFKVVK